MHLRVACILRTNYEKFARIYGRQDIELSLTLSLRFYHPPHFPPAFPCVSNEFLIKTSCELFVQDSLLRRKQLPREFVSLAKGVPRAIADATWENRDKQSSCAGKCCAIKISLLTPFAIISSSRTIFPNSYEFSRPSLELGTFPVVARAVRISDHVYAIYNIHDDH